MYSAREKQAETWGQAKGNTCSLLSEGTIEMMGPLHDTCFDGWYSRFSSSTWNQHLPTRFAGRSASVKVPVNLRFPTDNRYTLGESCYYWTYSGLHESGRRRRYLGSPFGITKCFLKTCALIHLDLGKISSTTTLLLFVLTLKRWRRAAS